MVYTLLLVDLVALLTKVSIFFHITLVIYYSKSFDIAREALTLTETLTVILLTVIIVNKKIIIHIFKLHFLTMIPRSLSRSQLRLSRHASRTISTDLL